MVESIAQSVKVIVILTGYIFVFVTLVKCINRFAESNLKIVEVRDINDSIKYRRIMFVMFLAVWSIHIIAYYPGLFTGDTEDIIYMAYNYHTGLADVVNLLSPEVFITDHHSVFFTLILGAFVKAARALNGNENTGIFAYSLVQMVAMSWVLAYGLYKLKNSGVPALIRHIAFVFLLLFSWIPRK